MTAPAPMSQQTADVLFGAPAVVAELGELHGLIRRIGFHPDTALRILQDYPSVPPTPDLEWTMPFPAWPAADFSVPEVSA